VHAARRPIVPVQLVGAGPGDPDLLTLRAARAIASADVLLVDDLADERVVALARADARVIRVGKRGGCRSTPQAFIQRLMVRLARTGARVVRLKGGDPMLFGRAGEEIAFLAAHGVPCEVVSGLTAGVAAAQALGTSLTHRELAHGVAFVTGHPAPGGDEADWAALARSGLTLAIYMGVARAAAIRDALRAGGLPDTLPAAIVQSAGVGHAQRTVRTTLGDLVETLAREGLGSPSILLVGGALGATAFGAVGADGDPLAAEVRADGAAGRPHSDSAAAPRAAPVRPARIAHR
jgi:uroporphyrin-III C-methyltransferase